MPSSRTPKIKLATVSPYQKTKGGNSTDIYGNGITFMLRHMGKKEIKTLPPNCFNVYERENWLV